MLKKVVPVLLSRSASSKFSVDGSFSTTRWFRAAASLAGSGGMVAICGTSAIEPVSGPRNRLLKTKTVKKELFAAAKCNVAGTAAAEVIPFNQLVLSCTVTLPVWIIIFSIVQVGVSGVFCL